MVCDAVASHEAFRGFVFRVYAKGSYPNNTNVRADSDVDIAVQCCEVIYWEEATPGTHGPSAAYSGPWTPARLRAEVEAALRKKFPGQVDATGQIAIGISSSSARVDADVVPCFSYEYHPSSGFHRKGTRVFKKNGSWIENFPQQQLENGRAKNVRTSQRFKQAVRVLKRVENAMVVDQVHREVPSFFVECLVYNCPEFLLSRFTWTDRISGLLGHIWDGAQGDTEPEEDERWLEANECKYLFSAGQVWSRRDAREFALAAWNYLEYT